MSYSVVFTGEIKASLSHEQVMKNLSLLFKKDVSFINKLFSGQHVTIKRNLDLASANKYQVALASAGAICEVKKAASEVSNSTPTSNTANLTMAAAGETIIEATQATQANFDISQFSMAAPGEKIIDQVPQQTVQINELSADLSPPGATLNEDKPVKAATIDVSGITLAESGHDIFDKK